MVVQVFRQASRASVLSDLLVATDSDEIVEACHAHHVPAVMTSAAHPSGTDRLWEVSRARAADVYVNIQGDYPTITPGHIERLVRPFLERARGPGDHAQDPRHAGGGREPHRQQGGHQRARRRPLLLAPAHSVRPGQAAAASPTGSTSGSTPIGGRSSTPSTRSPRPRSSERSSSNSCACWRPASRSTCSRPTSPSSEWIPRRISGPPRPSCRRDPGDQSLGRAGPDHGRPGHGQRGSPRHSLDRPAHPRGPRPLGDAGGLVPLRVLHRAGADLAARGLARRPLGRPGRHDPGPGPDRDRALRGRGRAELLVPGRDPGAGRRRLRRPQPHHHQGGHGVVPPAPARHRRGPQADRPAGRRRAGRTDDAPAGAGLRLAPAVAFSAAVVGRPRGPDLGALPRSPGAGLDRARARPDRLLDRAGQSRSLAGRRQHADLRGRADRVPLVPRALPARRRGAARWWWRPSTWSRRRSAGWPGACCSGSCPTGSSADSAASCSGSRAWARSPARSCSPAPRRAPVPGCWCRWPPASASSASGGTACSTR